MLIRVVGIAYAQPIADTLRETLPFRLVFPDGFPAFRVICSDAKPFNIFLALKSKLFFHLQLHRKSVGVPPTFSHYIFPPHGLVSAKEIFEGSANEVVDARTPVGRRRTLEENEGFSALPRIDGALKDAVLGPEL